MTGTFSNIFLSSSSRKILTYYTGYNCVFLFTYLSLVSTVSFFHFLLDHEMSVIENWITLNAWEVLVSAKAVAAFLSLKALRLNNYSLEGGRKLLKSSAFLPGGRAAIVCAFFMTFYTVLIWQFGSFETNQTSAFFAASFLGTVCFFLVDLFVIYSAFVNFPLMRRRQALFLFAALPALFTISSYLALPYLNERSFFLPLHFAALIVLLYKEKKNLGNALLYSALVIGPMSVLFGLDPVWGDAKSVYKFASSAPLFGVVLIWATGLLYYLRTNRPA